MLATNYPYRENDEFPEFYEAPVHSEGRLIEDCKAIKRKSLFLEEQPAVKVVGKGFKLIQHEDMYDKYYSILSQQIPTEHWNNVECSKRFSPNGAKMTALFKFPSLYTEYKVDNTAHKRTFHAYLKNAVDGEWSAKSGVGLMDFFCANFEMGGEWAVFTRKHTSGFNLDEFVAPQVNYISSFDQMVRKHDHQITTSCDNAKTLNYLQTIPRWNKQLCDEDGRKLEYADGSAVIELNSSGNKLFDQWEYEAKNRGSNIFALSSALTYWASHDSDEFPIKKTAGVKNTLSVLSSRQEFVGNLLKETPFVAA